MGGRRRGWVSTCSVCRSYGSSTGTACIGMGLIGGWKNLVDLLDSVGVGCGQMNLGVAILCKCRVCEVFFWRSLGFCWTL